MKRDLIYFVIILVLAILFLRECNRKSKSDAEIAKGKVELERLQNNFDAQNDSIQTYRKKSGELVAIISGYQITEEELNSKYADLFSSYKKEKNKKPISIVDVQVVLTEKVVDFTVTDVQNGQTGEIKFKSDTVFSEGNSRVLNGVVPFHINYFAKKDSSLIKWDSIANYAKIYPDKMSLENQITMSLTTGLRKNKKDGKIEIWAETKYPGVTFSKLQGANIMSDPISKKVARSLRKQWGIGFNVGYGPTFVQNKIQMGAYFGIGLNYSPKILQF